MAVILGRIRGSGRQLASYLLAKGGNEQVRILDVDGLSDYTDMDLRNLLGDFSLNEKLTRSRQGLYHASINPSEETAKVLSDEEWFTAVDILAEELGFAGQRRAMVLHTKLGRTHCHVAFERYDHEKKNRMIPIDHNYSKHDKARAKMEQLFQEQPTPRRNPNRDGMKATLTALWKETTDAASFIRKARAQGYGISSGIARTPYMVVDESGRSFNLVRHLNDIRIKEVRERFRDTVLPGEKEAIAFVRTSQSLTGSSAKKQAAKQLHAEPDEAGSQPGKEKSLREAFMDNLRQQRQQQQMRPKTPKPR